MDLIITTEEAGDVVTVCVAGRLVAGGAAELERTCRRQGRLRLDISELVSADEEGTSLLLRLRDAGAELARTPPYIDLLLRTRSARAP